MEEFVLRQEALKHEVSELKEKVWEVLIALKTKMKKDKEHVAASVGHHIVIPQLQNLDHRHGAMVRVRFDQLNLIEKRKTFIDEW